MNKVNTVYNVQPIFKNKQQLPFNFESMFYVVQKLIVYAKQTYKTILMHSTVETTMLWNFIPFCYDILCFLSTDIRSLTTTRCRFLLHYYITYITVRLNFYENLVSLGQGLYTVYINPFE
jgi:hypothetical protein